MKCINKKETQAIIPEVFMPNIQAYYDLLGDRYYSNQELEINTNKDRIEVGALEFSGGAFFINNGKGIFKTTPYKNIMVTRQLTNSGAIIGFSDPNTEELLTLGFELSESDIEDLNCNESEFTYIHVNAGEGYCEGKEFCSLYHYEALGLPQCFYDSYAYMVENNIYSRESALAVFGAYMHQLIVPIDDPDWLTEEDQLATQVDRQMTYYFAAKELVLHDLNYAREYYRTKA
ncbi:hypothetical protein [uncultured Psychromonas sp.]|uniref:hypothetical protein n=1 Tax=uncultured Psychromonas sp. TaxID=173974 RepID=UPI002619EF54|nr:hypothetical protein [uncultured Psychromonas sp.]